MERGLEADHCFYFDLGKITQAAAAPKRRDNDIAAYPNPDLAIEIELSPSLVDRPAIYAALGVLEVWRFNGEVLRVERLTGAQTYAPTNRGAWLNVDAAEILAWITDDDAHDRGGWARRLRAWARGRGG